MNRIGKLVKIRYIGVAIALVFIIFMLVHLAFNADDKPVLDLDSFCIENLTEDVIVGINHATSFMSSLKTSGKGSGIYEINYIEKDKTKITFSAKKTTGIQTISATRAKDCTVLITINGKASVAIVMDDVLLECFALGEKNSFEYDVQGDHNIYVKILCEEAEITIVVERAFENKD